MVYSKLTQKYQATIPLDVRVTLGLKEGDRLGFEIVEGEVILKKISPLDIEFARSVESGLEEWSSKADDEAYRDL